MPAQPSRTSLTWQKAGEPFFRSGARGYSINEAWYYSDMKRGLEQGTGAIAALQEEVRRRLYLFVRAQGRAVSREEAATAVRISRKLAAFHLDKLVDRGLLTFHYARPAGRSGRGAGRTSKLYEPSDLEVEVSIPERRYDLVGGLLVKAIEEESLSERAREAARRVARREGLELGESIRREKHLRPPGPERTLAVAEEVLARHGYEPARDHPGEITLRNCPFQTLATDAPGLICDMNRDFIEGFVRGLGNDRVEAALERGPGRCCVKLRVPSGAPG